MVMAIPLTRGFTALVDDEDFERVSARKWYAQSAGPHIYAGSSDYAAGKSYTVLLHRFILDLGRSRRPIVDHIDGNTLDCRRTNLRACTFVQNIRNARPKRDGLKGAALTWNGRWRAKITINYKDIHLGCYDTEIEAAVAYDVAARHFFGEFARLNFPNIEQSNLPPCALTIAQGGVKCLSTKRGTLGERFSEEFGGMPQ